MDCHYEHGLKFACTSCRYCCSGEPGYVFLSQEDFDRIVDFLGITPAQLLSRYCRKIPFGTIYYVSLQETAQFDCIFLNERGCSIYEARPLQCRTYPFWAHIVESAESWHKEAQVCPGIGKGKLFSRSDIELLLDARRGHEMMTLTADESFGT